MGVWIEILKGLSITDTGIVTPFVGVWIEIVTLNEALSGAEGHSLRGSVD